MFGVNKHGYRIPCTDYSLHLMNHVVSRVTSVVSNLETHRCKTVGTPPKAMQEYAPMIHFP